MIAVPISDRISNGDRAAADSALIPGGCHRLGRSRGMTVVTAGDELLVLCPKARQPEAPPRTVDIREKSRRHLPKGLCPG